MLTICTNDETCRSTLESALAVAGATEDETAAIIEVDEADIWQQVCWHLDEAGIEYTADSHFANWNGGKRDQFGHRCGLAHSDTSHTEAATGDNAINRAVTREAIDFLNGFREFENDE